MSNPTEGEPRIEVRVYWDRTSGTFSSTVDGNVAAEVAVTVQDDEGYVYGNDTADPDPDPEPCEECDGSGEREPGRWSTGNCMACAGTGLHVHAWKNAKSLGYEDEDYCPGCGGWRQYGNDAAWSG